MAGPGGALTCTDSHSPAIPSRATRATVASCHGRRREQTRRVVAAGTTSSAVASSAPERRERRDRHERHQREQDDVGRRRAGAEGPRGARVEPRRQPALLEHQPAGEHDRGADGGEGPVARVDEQQAAEQQRLDVARGVEDVAGEDHADGQRGDEDERRERVVAVARALAAREQPDGDGDERGGRAARPARRRSRARRRARAPGTRPSPRRARRTPARAARSTCRSRPRPRRGSGPRRSRAGRREAGTARAWAAPAYRNKNRSCLCSRAPREAAPPESSLRARGRQRLTPPPLAPRGEGAGRRGFPHGPGPGRSASPRRSAPLRG